jgi:hypothetical protein
MIRITETRVIAAGAQCCFDVTRSVDFHKVTGRHIRAEAVAGRKTGLSEHGDWTVWSARFFGVRFRIRMEARDFNPPTDWIDAGRSFLFRTFSHRYKFEEIGSPENPLTRFTDDFGFALRGGILAAPIER